MTEKTEKTTGVYLMTINNMEPVEFKALGGRRFRFDGKMHDPRTLIVWELKGSADGFMNDSYKVETLGGLRVDKIEIETLKNIGVWDILSPEIQKELTTVVHEERQEVNSLMEKAREARKSKYANMPKELVCIKCGTRVNIQPGVLVARLEKMSKDGRLITVDDYVKAWSCQKCHPTKGRRPDPKLAHLPKELSCKCGSVMPCSVSYIGMRAKSKGVTPEEFIHTYVCQKCNSTKGRRPKK